MSLLLLLKWQPLVGYTAPKDTVVIETSGGVYRITSQGEVNRPQVVVISE